MANTKQFTQEEKDLLKARGMPWRLWGLIHREEDYIIVRNLINGNVRMIEKG